MGRAIFISYRRDDSEGEAGRLFDDLVRVYGEKSVFMDVAGINPGIDFRKAIDDNVATCGVLLAIIGPQWATINNSAGQLRLNDENDFVRLEVASALARDIPVIPVLVHNATMPRPDALPENLKNLAFRNSVELTHARWNSDVQLLTKALAQYVAASNATGTEPIHATVSVQLPPANAPEPKPAPATKSRTPLMAGIALAVVLAIAAAIYFGMNHGSPSNGGTPVNPQNANSAAGAAPPATTTPVRGLTSALVGAGALAGTWTNSASVERNGLAKLEIVAKGDSLSLHAWGQCDPDDCDWGEEPSRFDGARAIAAWTLAQPSKREKAAYVDQETRVATVTLVPDGGVLHVTVQNTYSSQKPTERQFDFVKAQ
ncbi:MAG TPA: toll/interleukin-1 receptor domain-containing protein [Acidobacteriaceae bacterium]